MFHVEHWDRVALYLGRELTLDQVEKLQNYRNWLISEAIPAGGLGPGEADRVDTRHIADSMLFAGFLDEPSTVWDLGSGVGLPGIPLAILLPDCSFALIDRSGRRTDLMNRAVRLLNLDNVRVIKTEVRHLEGRADAIVSRGTIPPDQLLTIMKEHLYPNGVGVTGGSWTVQPRGDGWETVEVPAEVLDRPVWILIMRNS